MVRREVLGKKKGRGAAPVEMVVFDSAYVPVQDRPARRGASFFASFFFLWALVMILCGTFVSAFRISPVWLLLIPFTVLGSLFFTWFFLEKRLDGYRILAGLLLTALYGGAAFACQRRLQNGFFRVAALVARRINETYAGNLPAAVRGTKLDGTVFLLFVLFLLTGLLAAGTVRRQSVLMASVVLFPVLALTAVVGGRPAQAWLYLAVIIVIVLLAASRRRLPGWQAPLAAGFLAAVVSVPAWYLAQPLLALRSLGPAKTFSRLETQVVQSLYQFLPRISGGKLSLSVDGIGGGVAAGTLGAVEGYFFTGTEALRVTSKQQPPETVYLKGFIGQEYTGTSYQPGEQEDFVNASSSWKTEGDASLYIQNLPFLRMMYYEKYGGDETEDGAAAGGGTGSGAETAGGSTGSGAGTADGNVGASSTAGMISVQNLNANSAYSYVPYQAFLNDYYQVCGGDGYVSGQTVQDDIFPCYWRSNYQEAMEARRDAETEAGVLDAVESSYRAYCTQHDLQIPESGLEKLKEECEAAAEENGWNQNKNGGTKQPGWAVADEIEEIRHYILKRLLTGCEYELDVDALPEGKDFIEYFLYESQEGYSMHFAAAATMMFRMFGVPARYVVGYAAPKELFSPDDNGTYTAILEDDNAHAWTEIYQPFLGWTPVEVTPGMEAELTGDYYMEETETETEQQTEAGEDGSANGRKNTFHFTLPSWLNGNLDTVMFFVQVLLAFGAAGYLLYRIRSQRKKRLGLGADPGERIGALYRSLYRLLTLSGMPEDCTITRPEELFSWLSDAVPSLTEDELVRLQNLILITHYGRKTPTEEEADWMYTVYIKTWRGLRKKLSAKMRLSYLLRG